MSQHDINKFYVSPFDRFMFEFDATHGKSESQRKEIEKHNRIAALRDGKPLAQDGEEVWSEF